MNCLPRYEWVTELYDYLRITEAAAYTMLRVTNDNGSVSALNQEAPRAS